MIQITKGSAPSILSTKGVEKIDDLKSDFNLGKIDFDFDSRVYGHATVKDALKAAQHGKCCFCEGKFKDFAYGDVEHFRPKAGYKQNDEDELQKPGYYWLAYDWDNLFYSCQVCNQQYKKNFFPLSDPEQRAKSHYDDIKKEDPLIVHPSLENPEDHISFRKEVVYGKTDKGDETIKRTGLRRLNESRREVYEIIKAFLKIVNSDIQDDIKKDAILYLEKVKKDSYEFRGMIKANFPELI